MIYMLDTNICIYLIKERSRQLVSQLRRFHTGELGVSAIVVGELYYGVSKSTQKDRNRAALAAFLLPFEIAPLSDEVMPVYGQLRTELEVSGNPIGSLDMLIAAHALALDVPLVTNNTHEFARVKGLRLEDWSA